MVSVGTGDACIVNSNLTTDGRVVMDCHAEVVARKALMKYDVVHREKSFLLMLLMLVLFDCLLNKLPFFHLYDCKVLMFF